MIERPPVVAILGHIDHGKSTLLDYIRQTNTTDKEIGGITQNMSAYEVVHNGKKITFLDTPGHEAFSALRSQGARVANVGILVVSAEDGVKSQTIEALKSILDAKLPYFVAINKMDKPGADLARTKQSLLENEIYVEGYGGTIPAVPISAKTGEGIPELLDMITLMTEMESLQSDPALPASGIVLSTNRDQKKGISATLIIQNGTLKTGMVIVSGASIAPVRAIEDFQGSQIKEATFSSPVRIVGFDSLPQVGTTFEAFENKKEAELALTKNKTLAESKASTTQKQDPSLFYIPLIIKANTSGVLEAIVHEIRKLETDKVKARIINTGVGDISENDVKLGSGSPHTIILGFSNKIDALGRMQAEKLGLEVQIFDIIYKLSEWLGGVFKERAPKTETEEEKGKIKVLKIFSKTKDKQIIGCRMEQGLINLGDDVKIIRRESLIGQGKVRELQQAKNKATEVKEGLEFGTMIESKIEIAPGDYLLPYSLVTK